MHSRGSTPTTHGYVSPNRKARYAMWFLAILILLAIAKQSTGGCDLPTAEEMDDPEVDNEVLPSVIGAVMQTGNEGDIPIGNEVGEQTAVELHPSTESEQTLPPVPSVKVKNTESDEITADVPTKGRYGTYKQTKTTKPEVTEGYILHSVIPQQFVSALQQGFMRFLKTAVLTSRTAVIPQSRFDEPGFRLTVPPEREDIYYDLGDLIDTNHLYDKWTCLSRTTQQKWSAETNNTVDLLLIVTGGSMTCFEKYVNNTLSRRSPAKGAPYLGGSFETKMLDTIHGRMKIKEAKCISASMKADDLKEIMKGYKSVLISQIPFDFLQKGWYGICNGAGVVLPKVAAPWQALGQKYISDKFPSRTGHGCVQLRFEKMVRSILLSQKTLPWKPIDGGKQYTSPALESCLEAVLEMITYMTGQSNGNLFLMHDMDAMFGTATTHFGGMSSPVAYKVWTTWAMKRISEVLPKHSVYCGSDEHKKDESAGTLTGGILKGNKRSCALVEAAVCTKAKKRMRIGSGSFGAFVTNINLGRGLKQGPTEWGYTSCPAIESAAQKCRESKKCKPIKLRES